MKNDSLELSKVQHIFFENQEMHNLFIILKRSQYSSYLSGNTINDLFYASDYSLTKFPHHNNIEIIFSGDRNNLLDFFVINDISYEEEIINDTLCLFRVNKTDASICFILKEELPSFYSIWNTLTIDQSLYDIKNNKLISLIELSAKHQTTMHIACPYFDSMSPNTSIQTNGVFTAQFFIPRLIWRIIKYKMRGYTIDESLIFHLFNHSFDKIHNETFHQYALECLNSPEFFEVGLFDVLDLLSQFFQKNENLNSSEIKKQLNELANAIIGLENKKSETIIKNKSEPEKTIDEILRFAKKQYVQNLSWEAKPNESYQDRLNALADTEFAFDDDACLFVILSYPSSDLGKGTFSSIFASTLEEALLVKFDGVLTATGSEHITNDIPLYKKWIANDRSHAVHLTGGYLYLDYLFRYPSIWPVDVHMVSNFSTHFRSMLGEKWRLKNKPKNILLEIGGTLTDQEVDPIITPALHTYKQKMGDRCKIILLTHCFYNPNWYVTEERLKTKNITRAVVSLTDRNLAPDLVLIRQPESMKANQNELESIESFIRMRVMRELRFLNSEQIDFKLLPFFQSEKELNALYPEWIKKNIHPSFFQPENELNTLYPEKIKRSVNR